MRRLHSLFQDGFEEEASTASRRSMIVGSLKLASGGALALAITGTPGIARLAGAENHETGQGGGGGGGGRGGDGQGGGGGGGGRGGQDAQGGGQVSGVPRTGIGIAGGSDGQTVGLIGLAAAAAAAGAVFLRQRTSTEQPTDV